MFKNENLQILYGSQTGNAQDVAERIWRDSKRCYFSSSVKAMDDYNISELIHEKCVIFVCSTTGQGEEPANMKTFWKFLLRKNLPLNSLANLRFAVFGLGDSGYAKFNFAAKKLHKRLMQLGAQQVIGLGLGDDQHDFGYDAAADPWIESLWANLLTIYPLPKGIQQLEKNIPILPRWNVTSFSSLKQIHQTQSIYYSTRKPNDLIVTVLENKRTTAPDHFQDVRFIKLQTDGRSYCPGDVIALMPKNLPWQVEEFKNVLTSNGISISDDSIFNLNEIDPQIPVPTVLKREITFHQLCEEYFDLNAIPRRFTFNILAQITDSDLEKEKCLEFTTPEGQDDLYSYCNRPKRNIVEVLRDFPNATKNLTSDMLFEILSPIRPREFSIASAASLHKNEIHILLAVVKYKTKLAKERYGLCSNYLSNLRPGDEIIASVKRGTFRFPTGSQPVIMVGPGTGVAPFRSFIFERVASCLANRNNSVLVFGCRNDTKDFHCKEEFTSLANEGKLHLITAFSRKEERKIYVQHRIADNQELMWDFLTRGGSIFVAGSAKSMPQEVRDAFIKVCENCGKLTNADAENYVKNMEKCNRYQTECWS